jgi:hypothetical protein
VRQYGFPLGNLLEAGRDLIARRRLAGAAGLSASERTAGSGRILQPAGSVLGTAARWGTAPFRVAQRAFPGLGPGLVARARLPGHPGTGGPATGQRGAVGNPAGGSASGADAPRVTGLPR